MRARINSYEVHSPRRLNEAVQVLANEPNTWQPLAGGTDLMVAFSAGNLPCRRFMNLWSLDELRGIHIESDAVVLGALTTYSDVLQHAALRSTFPLLAAAAAETGGVAIQNRGTLGGNIMNASPAADTPPALLVYDAEIELTSLRGSRWVPYCRFHTGYRQTILAPDELLTRIRFPHQSGCTRSRFRKVGARKAMAISKVCFAALWDLEQNEIRIAYGSVAPFPLRCFATEASIRKGEDAAKSLAQELLPINDNRSNAAYRLRVAQNLLADFLNNNVS